MREVVRQVKPGQRVSIYWHDDQQWYSGIIQRTSADGAFHTVAYDDGDVESLDLLEETFRLDDATATQRDEEMQDGTQAGANLGHALSEKREKRQAAMPKRPESLPAQQHGKGRQAQQQSKGGGGHQGGSKRKKGGAERERERSAAHLRAQSVKEWLESLGLSKYLSVFELNEVDMDVLPYLTLEDLRDMPVRAIGPRRKMLNSLESLRSMP